MAYDETLAERVRSALGARDDVIEKRMFGGLAFMLGGHLTGFVFVDGDALSADAPLSKWVERGVAFAGSLEPRG